MAAYVSNAVHEKMETSLKEMLSNSTVCLEFKEIKGKLCVVIILRDRKTNEAIMEYAPIENVRNGLSVDTGIFVNPHTVNLHT